MEAFLSRVHSVNLKKSWCDATHTAKNLTLHRAGLWQCRHMHVDELCPKRVRARTGLQQWVTMWPGVDEKQVGNLSQVLHDFMPIYRLLPEYSALSKKEGADGEPASLLRGDADGSPQEMATKKGSKETGGRDLMRWHPQSSLVIWCSGRST